MSTTPTTTADYIETIRAGFTCSRCGRYVGALAAMEYVPPPYAVAVAGIPMDDEAGALVAFEWHMLALLRQGKFTLAHPERDGLCISAAEWAREELEVDEATEEGDV